MFRNLHTRVVMPIAALMAVGLAASTWVTWNQLAEDVAKSLESYASGLSSLLVGSLKESMRENDRDHITEVVQDIGQLEWVETIRVVDKQGVVRFASDPGQRGTKLSEASEACRTCHRHEPVPTSRAATESAAGLESRWITAEAIRLDAECLHCHQGAEGQIAGVLIVELDASRLTLDVKERALRNLRILVGGSLSLLVLFVLVVRGVVTRRLLSLADALAMLRSGETVASSTGGRGDEIDELADALAALGADMEDRAFAEDIARALERDLNGVGYPIVLVDPSGDVLVANDLASPQLPSPAEPGQALVYSRLDEARAELWAQIEEEPIASHAGQPGVGSERVLLTVCDDSDDVLLYVEVGRQVDPAQDADPQGTKFPSNFLRNPYHDVDPAGDRLFRAVVLLSMLPPGGASSNTVFNLDRTLVTGLRTVNRMDSIRSLVDDQVGLCDVSALASKLVRDVARATGATNRVHTVFSGTNTVVGHPVILRQLLLNLVQLAQGMVGHHLVVFTHPQTDQPRFFLGLWVDGHKAEPPQISRLGLARDLTTRLGGVLEFDPAYDIDKLARLHARALPSLGVGRLLLLELPYSLAPPHMDVKDS